jgi:REP-associated tyrosine transposase
MSNNTASNRPVRKQLDHTIHFHGRFGATYFITTCCQARRMNQLCHDNVAGAIFETARRYHESQRWYVKLLLLMPDHLHMLIGVSGDAELSKLIRDFKRTTTRIAKIDWQRNFFDHRLRHDESETEKFEYICQNPVRAGLIGPEEKWRYAIDANDLEMRSARRSRTARAIEVNRPYLLFASTLR